MYPSILPEEVKEEEENMYISKVEQVRASIYRSRNVDRVS